jgi:predicted dehydrogenase
LSPLRIAIVGTGGIARAHLAAAAELPEIVRLTAFAEPGEEARAKFAEVAGDARPFDSAQALLAAGRDVTDALILCTPPSVRREVVEPALAAGLGVLCEKPLARTADDAQALKQLAAERPSVPAAVAYCHRFAPAVIEMKRRLETGDLGQLVRIENTFACDFPALRDRWMSDPAVSGGGSFLDTGCHSLDLLQHLAGPAQLAGATFRHAWQGRGESSAAVLLRLPHDAAGIIHSGWTEPEAFTLSLVGTAARLDYNYMAPTVLHHQPPGGERQEIHIETHEVRFTRQLAAFATYHQTGDPGTMCTFTEAATVNALIAKAQTHAQPGHATTH